MTARVRIPTRCGPSAKGASPHDKVPRSLHTTDDFPMTITGKVQKCKMREAAIDVLGLHDADAIRTA